MWHVLSSRHDDLSDYVAGLARRGDMQGMHTTVGFGLLHFLEWLG